MNKKAVQTVVLDTDLPTPVSLHGIEQAVGYLKLQMPLHYRVMITDQRDYCVLEARNGKIAFPPAHEDA